MSDVDILQYALTLEHLEGAMYKEMLATKILTGKDLQYLQSFGEHESDHVDALTKALQAAGVEPWRLCPNITSRPLIAVTRFSVLPKLPRIQASAPIKGQQRKLPTRIIWQPQASIMQVEARHAAMINVLLGMKPAPDAVTASLTMDEVLQRVNPILGK